MTYLCRVRVRRFRVLVDCHRRQDDVRIHRTIVHHVAQHRFQHFRSFLFEKIDRKQALNCLFSWVAFCNDKVRNSLIMQKTKFFSMFTKVFFFCSQECVWMFVGYKNVNGSLFNYDFKNLDCNSFNRSLFFYSKWDWKCSKN